MNFNPYNRQLLMRSAIESYYQVIGLTPEDSRKADQVKARNAIGVALSKWSKNQQEVAKMLGRDRSTIAHMNIEHEDNLQHWSGYKNLFEYATLIVDSRMSTSSTAEKLSEITNRIFILEQEATRLRKELEEKLKIEIQYNDE